MTALPRPRIRSRCSSRQDMPSEFSLPCGARSSSPNRSARWTLAGTHADYWINQLRYPPERPASFRVLNTFSTRAFVRIEQIVRKPKSVKFFVLSNQHRLESHPPPLPQFASVV